MHRHRPSIDDHSHDAFLIRAYGCNDTKSSQVDLLTTVTDDVDNHFLPAVLTL